MVTALLAGSVVERDDGLAASPPREEIGVSSDVCVVCAVDDNALTTDTLANTSNR